MPSSQIGITPKLFPDLTWEMSFRDARFPEGGVREKEFLTYLRAQIRVHHGRHDDHGKHLVVNA